MKRCLAFALIVFATCLGAAHAEPATPSANRFLAEGRIAAGIRELTAELDRHPGDEQMRYGLGVLQFMRAIEKLGQSLYRYGLLTDGEMTRELPIARLPVPKNPAPDRIDYLTARGIIQTLNRDLAEAERTLADVRDDAVRLPLDLGAIRLDITSGAQPTVPLRVMLARYFGGESSLPKDRRMRVVFGRADVAWFRGYCHLLLAQTDLILAYGEQELFDSTAQLLFARPVTPYPFLLEDRGKWHQQFADTIAFIHLLHLPIKEPARFKSIPMHLGQMIALSRETWKYVMADTSKDPKWLPNPRQHGVLGIPISAEMIDGWLAFLDEMQAVLEGRHLLPFWRSKQGINLRRVFDEPRPFDLVLWVQGTGAAPYLEDGEISRRELWNRLWRIFNGQFIGFAIWFN